MYTYTKKLTKKVNIMDFAHRINTSGDGFWSGSVKEVSVLNITVPYMNDAEDFGELRVYFDTDSWDIHEDGLIYTDKNFQKVLKLLLTKHGLYSDDVSYSEQGMQGEDYVSLDVGKKFLSTWIDLNGVQI